MSNYPSLTTIQERNAPWNEHETIETGEVEAYQTFTRRESVEHDQYHTPSEAWAEEHMSLGEIIKDAAELIDRLAGEKTNQRVREYYKYLSRELLAWAPDENGMKVFNA